MQWPVAYIADVRASAPVLAKIKRKHNVSYAEVKEAVVLTKVRRSVWDFDPERGLRLLVTGDTYDHRRTLDVVLYPISEIDGIWNLGTAVPWD